MFSFKMRYKKIDSIYRHFLIILPRMTPSKLFNLSKCYLSYILKKERVDGYPSFLKVEPASICNLRCYGCRSGKENDLVHLDSGVMNFELFEMILLDLKPYLFEIGFYLWGEPLMNRDLAKMVSLAHRNKIGSIVSTNLHFLNEEIAKELIQAGLDRMIVAIDGMTQSSYGSLRVGGKLEKVLENLSILINAKKELVSRKPVIEWQFVVTENNKAEIEQAKLHAKKLGVDYFILIPDWGKRGDDSSLMEARKKSKIERIKGCKWLWFALAIQWNGDIFPCCHAAKKKEWAFESISRSPFSQIWNGELYKASRMIFSRRRNEIEDDDHTPICYKCPMI